MLGTPHALWIRLSTRWIRCPLREIGQTLIGHWAPQRYFVPPYVGRRGWIGVYLDVEGAGYNEAF
jgi:hypothetical protein